MKWLCISLPLAAAIIIAAFLLRSGPVNLAVTGSVTTQTLRIIDGQGKVKAILSASEEVTSLLFLRPDGSIAISIAQFTSGRSVVELLDPAGKTIESLEYPR
jgi:hypothetical protein